MHTESTFLYVLSKVKFPICTPTACHLIICFKPEKCFHLVWKISGQKISNFSRPGSIFVFTFFKNSCIALNTFLLLINFGLQKAVNLIAWVESAWWVAPAAISASPIVVSARTSFSSFLHFPPIGLLLRDGKRWIWDWTSCAAPLPARLDAIAHRCVSCFCRRHPFSQLNLAQNWPAHAKKLSDNTHKFPSE